MGLTQLSKDGVKDQAIDLTKLLHGTSSNDGKFLRANNGADPTFESVITDLVNDSSPQLGGNLDVNGKNIAFGDSSDGSSDDVLSFGDSGDLKIWHNGTNTYIRKTTGQLLIGGTGGDLVLEALGDVRTVTWEGENMIYARRNGAVELYHNNVKALSTTITGVGVFGNNGNGILDIIPTGSAVYSILNFYNVGQSANAQIIASHGSAIYVGSGGSGDVVLRTGNSQNKVRGVHNGTTELYHSSNKKLETLSGGVNITGNLGIGASNPAYEVSAYAAAPQIRLEETSTGGSKRLDLGVKSNGQAYIGANQSSQTIDFETTNSKRLTIAADGSVLTSDSGTPFSWGSNAGHIIYSSGEYRSTSANGTHIRCNRMNGDGHVAQWYRGQTNMVGFISISSSGTSYGSGSSDERTKKNIEDWNEDVLSKFALLTPKTFNFNWEDDTAVKHKGYIAQNEVNKFPEAYPKNNLTDCDNEFYQFTPTDMTVYLMKGLKEAAEKIAALETKVAALEAA